MDHELWSSISRHLLTRKELPSSQFFSPTASPLIAQALRWFHFWCFWPALASLCNKERRLLDIDLHRRHSLVLPARLLLRTNTTIYHPSISSDQKNHRPVIPRPPSHFIVFLVSFLFSLSVSLLLFRYNTTKTDRHKSSLELVSSLPSCLLECLPLGYPIRTLFDETPGPLVFLNHSWAGDS